MPVKPKCLALRVVTWDQRKAAGVDTWDQGKAASHKMKQIRSFNSVF